MDLKTLEIAIELKEIIDISEEIYNALCDKNNQMEIWIRYNDPQFEGRTSKSIDPELEKNVIKYLQKKYGEMNEKALNEFAHL